MLKNATPRVIGRLALISALAMLAACGDGQDSPTSQVVAKVNDREITVSQLNQALESVQIAADSNDAAKQALDSLIDEELLVQQAMIVKLDRDPTVMQAMEHARRQALVQAYLTRNVVSRREVTLTEEEEYYKQHPELFAKRRIYQFTVLTLPLATLDEELSKELDSARSLEQIEALLKRRNMWYDAQDLSRGAEQMPLDLLPKLASANVGDVLIVPQADGKMRLMVLRGFDTSPVTLAQAAPSIAMALNSMRNQKTINQHLAQVKTGARISYSSTMSKIVTSPAKQPVNNAPDNSGTKALAMF